MNWVAPSENVIVFRPADCAWQTGSSLKDKAWELEATIASNVSEILES
jgi:hypothetical protein